MNRMECLIVLSPFYLIFLLVFNVPDTKFLFSRLTILVSIYCAVRYKSYWALNLKDRYVPILLGFLFVTYFFLMQYLNEGNSDFPRSVLYLILYFLFLPFGLISINTVFYMVSFGCVLSGASSFYEWGVLGAERVGYIVSNPIPFSYYAGVCAIATAFLFFVKFKNKCFTYFDCALLTLAIGSSLLSIVLSQTRATFLSLFLIIIFISSLYFFRSPSVKKLSSIMVLFFILIVFFSNIPDVKYRVIDAWEQISNYSNNDYYSSTGIRIKLWLSGIDIFRDGVLVGHSKSEVRFMIVKGIEDGLYPIFLGPFLNHPNPNFHNQFIQSLVDGGIVGFILVCLLLVAPLFSVAKSKITSMKLFAGSIILFTMICLWFDSLFLYNQTIILYCSLTILMYVIGTRESLENEK